MDIGKLTDEQVIELIRRMKPARERGVMDAIKDSPIGGFVRGLRDPIDAGAQALSYLGPEGEFERVNDINRRAELDYQQNWRKGNAPTFDLPRIGGNLALSVLATRALPMNAPTMFGRMMQGAVAGGITSQAQPVDMSNPDTSFPEQKGKQALLGTTMGFVAPPLVEPVAKAVGSLYRAGRDALTSFGARASPQTINVNITQQVNETLRDAGMDLAAIPKSIRDSLYSDVAKAMASGQTIDKAALLRMADAKIVGVDLTRGQATRDPGQFAFERNTSGIVGAGERLQERFNQQNAQLIGVAGNGASQVTPYAAGKKIVSGLRNYDSALSGEVKQAYDAARTAAGSSADVPPQLLAQKAGEVLDTFGVENVPGVVRRRLESYGLLGGKQTKIFTVEEADQLRKVISANYDPANKAQAAALTMLRKGIDDAENALADAPASVGKEAAAAFAKARELAKSRFKTLEAVDAFQAAVDGAEPDKFVAKYIIGAPVNQVAELRSVMRKADPAMVETMRGQVLSWIKNNAINGASDEFGKFSQSQYQRALNSLGKEKIALLFKPSEVNRIYAIGRTASAIQAHPAGASVNTSNTASAAMNLLSRVSGVPYLGAAAKPLQSAITDAKVTASLTPTFNAGPQPLPDYIRKLIESAGPFAAVGGGLLGGDLGGY